MSRPLAYFLTWTTHGTWLHGDERGSVDRSHNAVNSPRLGPDSARSAMAARLLSSPVVVLSPTHRAVVDRAIRGVFSHRPWVLHALNVRSNHVHLVAAADETPERVMQLCRSWATRALREQSAFAPNQAIWTRHGSTIYLWTPGKVEEKIDYVLRLQDLPERWQPERRDRPDGPAG